MEILIVLWVMTSPGHWDRTELAYDTYKECHQVVHFLRDGSPEAKKWHKLHEYFTDEVHYSGIMFEDYCKGREK